MGVDMRVYCIWGVKIDFNDKLNEEIDQIDENLIRIYGYSNWLQHRPINTVVDGMGGNYMYLGVELFDSGSYRRDDFSGESHIDVESLSKAKDDYVKKFKEVFPNHINLLNHKWELHTFVHYS